jgi:hypothetical protein
VEETGDSVFPHEDRHAPPGRGGPGVHDGRTEPDHQAGWDWDHDTRPDAGLYGYRPGDEHRTLVQPGRPVPPPPPPGPRAGAGGPYGRPPAGRNPYAAAPGYGAPPGYGEPSGYGGAPAPYADPDPYRGPAAGGPMQRPAARRAPAAAPPDRRSRGDDRDRDDRDRPGGIGLPFGLGTAVGLLGLVALLLSLTTLPWFTVAGAEVAFPDIREAFSPPETQPGDVVAGAGEGTGATVPSSIPLPDDVRDAAEQEVRNAAGEAAASVIDTGKERYLEFYAETGWMAVAGAGAFAVLFATILSPKSFALSLILGFRRLSGFLVTAAGIAHGVALWVVFSGDGPAPETGVWVGVGGLVALFLACVIGPKRS